MIQTFLSNVAIILLVYLSWSTFLNKAKKISDKTSVVLKITVYSALIIFLFYMPIQFGDF
jgi:diguanylate cyclase